MENGPHTDRLPARHSCRMAEDDPQEAKWPGEGTITIRWQMTPIEGMDRLGWEFRSEPLLDPEHAIALLRDVANELEIDLP